VVACAQAVQLRAIGFNYGHHGCLP
jgi:hypothetical protein